MNLTRVMKPILIPLATIGLLAGLAAGPVSAASNPAPGTGLVGACNMLADATMLSIPMARDAAQGNAGMQRATEVSGDPGCS